MLSPLPVCGCTTIFLEIPGYSAERFCNGCKSLTYFLASFKKGLLAGIGLVVIAALASRLGDCETMFRRFRLFLLLFDWFRNWTIN